MFNLFSFLACVALLIVGAMQGWLLWACLIVWLWGMYTTEIKWDNDDADNFWRGLAIKFCWPLIFGVMVGVYVVGFVVGGIQAAIAEFTRKR